MSRCRAKARALKSQMVNRERENDLLKFLAFRTLFDICKSIGRLLPMTGLGRYNFSFWRLARLARQWMKERVI